MVFIEALGARASNDAFAVALADQDRDFWSKFPQFHPAAFIECIK
jgi:hypothetical protein